MSSDPYGMEFKALVNRIEGVINGKWPESLSDGMNAFSWARENVPDLMAKLDKQSEEVDSLWLNRSAMESFKGAVTEWGRTCLEIFRQFALGIRNMEAT